MRDDGLSETILSSRPVFDGCLLHVEVLDVRLPDGSASVREVVRHPGAAAVLPLWPDGTATMEKQYRAPLDRVVWEVPAGKLDDKGEDRLEAAKRELMEETGLVAGRWWHLGDIATSIGFTDEVIGLYAAADLRQGETRLDEDEFLHAERLPFAEVVQSVLDGRIIDSKTICAVLLANEKLRSGEIVL